MKKRLIIICFIVLIASGLLSCASKKLPCQPESAPMSAAIKITGINNEVILAETTVGIFEGNTILDILKYVTKENKIQMDYSGSGSTAYVKGISNLYEFDYGGTSGWIYVVNNDESLGTVSCGAYMLSDKDTITWSYVSGEK